ncbi:hypothetical protein KDA11_04075 [Candidatus Saccharibacteria bacterium]|nr:hypothetical protein [Candidatus Saccharibacteria bacterium]
MPNHSSFIREYFASKPIDSDKIVWDDIRYGLIVRYGDQEYALKCLKEAEEIYECTGDGLCRQISLHADYWNALMPCYDKITGRWSYNDPGCIVREDGRWVCRVPEEPPLDVNRPRWIRQSYADVILNAIIHMTGGKPKVKIGKPSVRKWLAAHFGDYSYRSATYFDKAICKLIRNGLINQIKQSYELTDHMEKRPIVVPHWEYPPDVEEPPVVEERPVVKERPVVNKQEREFNILRELLVGFRPLPQSPAGHHH